MMESRSSTAKRVVIASTFFLIGVLVVASQAVIAADGEAAASTTQENTHEMEAVVVNADAAAKTLTVEGGEGEPDLTLDVAEYALSQLTSLKRGDRVTLMCRDDADGNHQAVTDIQLLGRSS